MPICGTRAGVYKKTLSAGMDIPYCRRGDFMFQSKRLATGIANPKQGRSNIKVQVT